jgi:putative ABC transport system permease protein
MTEGFLLSCLAGLLGLILSTWAVDLIKASLPPDIAKFMAGWKEIAVDSRVLVFTVGVAFLTTLIFNLAPALQASRLDMNETLKEGGKSGDAHSRGGRARRLLVAAEMALALVLLVGAGLMVKGFWRIFDVFQGANPDRILTMQTPLPETTYQDPRKIAEFYQQVIERMKSLPDVQSVSAAGNTPLSNSPNPSLEFIVEGRPPLQPGEQQLADMLVISPDYFTTIGARLLAGRDFSDSDGPEAQPVVIISQLTARRYFAGDDPLGRRIKRSGPAADAPWLTIVGVVSDVKQSWFDKDIRPQVYLPYGQSPRAKMTLLVRTSSDPMNLVGAARAQIHSVDGDQPIDDIKTMAQLFRDEASPFRFAAALMLVFGAMALALSAVGVYGVTSYSVGQRTHEIGIRLALGARGRDVIWLIVGQGTKTAAIGLAVGLPLALGLSRLMANRLFGVVALEYAILIGFMAILVVVALLSSYLPARRATRVDPMVALRYE